VVFGETISAIGDTGMPEYVELALMGAITKPIKCMSIAFDHFCLVVSLRMPQAVLLSVCMGVAGCGWPNSSRAVHNGQTASTLRKSTPSSAFGSTGHNLMHHLAEDMDRSIIRWGTVFGSGWHHRSGTHEAVPGSM